MLLEALRVSLVGAGTVFLFLGLLVLALRLLAHLAGGSANSEDEGPVEDRTNALLAAAVAAAVAHARRSARRR